MLIGVLGAEGRMGCALRAAIDASKIAQLGAALTDPASPNLGKDAGGNIVFSADVRAALTRCDALIDFSSPKAAIDAALMMYETACKTLVTGTTGYSQTEEAALLAAADNITLVKSGNFSVGIRVLEEAVTLAAGLLAQTQSRWDISILDRHHRHKIDAPSGTALMLGQASGRKDVEYAAQRIGGIIGDHAVSFASPLETITLSHCANDRSLFAEGALLAALWAVEQPKGLYGMKDVLHRSEQ